MWLNDFTSIAQEQRVLIESGGRLLLNHDKNCDKYSQPIRFIPIRDYEGYLKEMSFKRRRGVVNSILTLTCLKTQ